MAKKQTTKTRKKLTRGERNIRWIERFLRIPEGKFVGKRVKLRSWQKKIIRGIYDTPTRRAIISFGRKNAKTTLSAMLLLLHLVGPERRFNSQLFSTALSRDQASLLFSLAAKMVRLSRTLSTVVTVRDTAKQLIVDRLGTVYRALSAEASTAMGLSPVFVVHDELGQVKGPRSSLYEAMETATGAQEDPLSIIISTQAPTEADLLSVLIDDAELHSDPKVKLFMFSADTLIDPFSIKAIKQANPAYGDFLNATEVRAMAADAKRMPSREAEYRNLVLNQRVDASTPFVSRSVWQSCSGDVIESLEGLDVYAGLDLSEVKDLTALVMIAKHEGKWHVKPTFWLPEDGIKECGIVDRVPYDLWKQQGWVQTTPGKSVDYEWIAAHLRELCSSLSVRAIAFDRWNFKHLRPWLLKEGWFEDELDELFIEFGQGFQSMSPALHALESLILNGNIVHPDSPPLTMCAANAVVQKDPAGNRKLTKSKSHGRIDGMVALAMAVSVATTAEANEPDYNMVFI